MIAQLLTKILASVLGRWILGGVVALLLGGGAWKWYDFKQKLREAGMQECVQEINQATVDALVAQLQNEKAANAALIARLEAAAAANREATERRKLLKKQLDYLRGIMEGQRETDEVYREWSATVLPDGVADRLRQAAGSETGSGDEDSS